MAWFVEVRNPKHRCQICKTDIHPQDAHVFEFRGRVRCVCDECSVKIEALFPDAGASEVSEGWI